MILLALLLQATPPPPPDIVVTAPPRATPQTPATIVVEPAAMMIASVDADGDGRTTRAELATGIERSFRAIDAGGGLRYLAFADWAARFLGDQNALPSPLETDRDNDGQVSLIEMQTQFARLYARYNRDGDDAVSRAELLTFRAVAIDANGPASPGERRRASRAR